MEAEFLSAMKTMLVVIRQQQSLIEGLHKAHASLLDALQGKEAEEPAAINPDALRRAQLEIAELDRLFNAEA